MDRVYQKVGRTAMPRSMKKKVKREKTEVKIDEHTLERLRYLGQLDPIEVPPKWIEDLLILSLLKLTFNLWN